MGHKDVFPPNRPNAGYVIGKETVAWVRGSGRDAPIPDLPAVAPKRGGSTLKLCCRVADRPGGVTVTEHCDAGAGASRIILLELAPAGGADRVLAFLEGGEVGLDAAGIAILLQRC